MEKMAIKNNNWIANERKKWIVFSLISLFLLATSIGLFFGIIGLLLFGYAITKTFIAVFTSSFCYLLITDKKSKLSEKDFSILLNQNFPKLEESAQLLIQPKSSYNILQSLQVNKIGTELSTIKPSELLL